MYGPENDDQYDPVDAYFEPAVSPFVRDYERDAAQVYEGDQD